MIVALILVLIAVGSVLFHWFSPWWWTPIASNWHYIDNTIIITFWITGVVFRRRRVCFMAYCVFRFRHRGGQPAHYEPENKRLEWWLTVVTGRRRRGHAGARPVRLEPVRQGPARRDRGRGRRPAMAVEFPAARQGRQARHVRPALSPPKIRSASIPNDPDGQDDVVVEAADLHLPVGKPVKVLLRSIDVLHDFYVPEFRAKMDMIPGSVTYFWFTPTRTGTFEILCAELCGLGHPQMRGIVVVETERTTRHGSTASRHSPN